MVIIINFKNKIIIFKIFKLIFFLIIIILTAFFLKKKNLFNP